MKYHLRECNATASDAAEQQGWTLWSSLLACQVSRLNADQLKTGIVSKTKYAKQATIASRPAGQGPLHSSGPVVCSVAHSPELFWHILECHSPPHATINYARSGALKWLYSILADLSRCVTSLKMDSRYGTCGTTPCLSSIKHAVRAVYRSNTYALRT